VPEYYFEREARTPNSESYMIEAENGRIGRVDIHFSTSGVVYGTLAVPERLTEEEIRDLIGEVDDRLVMTADPYREERGLYRIGMGRPRGRQLHRRRLRGRRGQRRERPPVVDAFHGADIEIGR
jgi:hypothetical protein